MQLASAPVHIHETNPAPKAGTDIATALDFEQPPSVPTISSHVSEGQPIVSLPSRHARLVTLVMTFAAVGPSSVAPHGFAFGGETLSAAQEPERALDVEFVVRVEQNIVWILGVFAIVEVRPEREGFGGAGVLDGEDDGNEVARCVGGVERKKEVDLNRIMGDGPKEHGAVN
ncbi:hypothetical protein V502_07644 [Pseudogymnoascus sp. VKM F-4520 (FW-2644)]|nr:hypothetical protein V502_07644 [Pseudogymnoascus sp. VKM F-4520 (FW-2644)]